MNFTPDNIFENRQDITYTPFNKVETLSEGTNALSLIYGPDNARKITELTQNGVTKKKIFAGALFEKEIVDGQERILNYVPGVDGEAAIYVTEGGSSQLYYIHKDYLGSYQTITNENGEIATLDGVEQVYSFDPWGRRRNASTWDYEEVPTAFLFDRGFTGHEHLDAFNLINMNGRVFDPYINMFLSPDPYIQAPGLTQSYNRYSYGLNNPFIFTDPSGYTWFTRLGRWLGKNGRIIANVGVGIAVAAAVVATAGAATPLAAAVYAGMAAGAATGMLNTAFNGGEWYDYAGAAVQGAVTGGFTAAATYGVMAGLGAAGEMANNAIADAWSSSGNSTTRILGNMLEISGANGLNLIGPSISSNVQSIIGQSIAGSIGGGLNGLASNVGYLGNASNGGDRDWRRRNMRRITNGSLFDERGRELLGRWLNGSGQPMVVHNGQWGKYMRSNNMLTRQIKAQLSLDAASRTSSGSFNMAFRPEIQNGYYTGYQMLHGPHSFNISGTATMVGKKIQYSFTATWVDVIDPNPIYPMDTYLSNILNRMYSPADYSVTISWDASYNIKP